MRFSSGQHHLAGGADAVVFTSADYAPSVTEVHARGAIGKDDQRGNGLRIRGFHHEAPDARASCRRSEPEIAGINGECLLTEIASRIRGIGLGLTTKPNHFTPVLVPCCSNSCATEG